MRTGTRDDYDYTREFKVSDVRLLIFFRGFVADISTAVTDTARLLPKRIPPGEHTRAIYRYLLRSGHFREV